ncbi:uncharacterized protein LOC135128204 [Zophobas morio]|uniref:uncharacterized protein LOC135128204 n=1 Tax=Zophobas morio TaxID=2755281 RepID=UPI003082971E
MSAYEKSCPLKKEDLGKGTSWRNRRLSLLQSGLRKLFNRAKNTKKIEDWEAFKEHRKEFKKELRKRKRETWRSSCSDITSTASAARLKRVLSKDYSYQPGFLKKEDDTFTATLEESAELLLQTMFPGTKRTISYSKMDVAGGNEQTTPYLVANAFNYIANASRKVVPKPGQQDYTVAKSYRAISLTSFLLKTLKRPSEKEIREIVLSKQPLHPNQHAYI